MNNDVNLPSFTNDNNSQVRSLKISQNFDNIHQNVNSIKEEIYQLQKLKNQSIICLHQYEHEYEIQKKIYEKFRLSCNPLPHRNEHPPPNDLPSKNDHNKYNHNLFTDSNSDLQKEFQHNTNTKSQEHDQKESEISSVSFKYVINSSNSFFNDSTVKLRFSLSTNALLASVRFDPSGEYFTYADSHTVFVLNASNGSKFISFSIPRVPGASECHPHLTRFSHDGNLLAVSCPTASIAVFSIPQKKRVALLEGHQKAVSGLAFSNSDPLLYSASQDGSLCLWDTNTFSRLAFIQHSSQTNQPQLTYSLGPIANYGFILPFGNNFGNSSDNSISAIAVAEDGSCIVVAFGNGIVGIYDKFISSPIRTFNAQQGNLFEIMTSPVEPIFVTGSSDNSAKLWNLKDGQNITTLTSHTDSVIACAFSHHENLLFTGSRDETIKIWDTKTNQLLFTIKGYQNTVFEIDHHPKDRCFISCSGDGVICLWEYSLPPSL